MIQMPPKITTANYESFYVILYEFFRPGHTDIFNLRVTRSINRSLIKLDLSKITVTKHVVKYVITSETAFLRLSNPEYIRSII